jgi:NAD(P)H-dependent FMN reductase
MFVLGVMGSPNKKGLTTRLLARALEGAKAAGAEVQQVDLIDYAIQPWPRSVHDCDETLDRLSAEADAIVLASPVFYKDVTGLMRDYIDYLHNVADVSRVGGKSGFGISLAGGSGMGQVVALQSMYGFYFFRGYRPIDPIAVSRFNYDDALDTCYQRGREVLTAAASPQPFVGLADKVTYYSGLQYLDYDLVDELLLVVEQMLSSAEVDAEVLGECREQFCEAREAVLAGRRQDAIAAAAAVYDRLFHRRRPS